MVRRRKSEYLLTSPSVGTLLSSIFDDEEVIEEDGIADTFDAAAVAGDDDDDAAAEDEDTAPDAERREGDLDRDLDLDLCDLRERWRPRDPQRYPETLLSIAGVDTSRPRRA